jgi:3-hydroxybutyryl-CoA dehydratase
VSTESFSAIAVGETTEATITVTNAHFVAAGELFRDLHPIHHDDDYARRRGHPGKTLPGAVISGIMSSSLAEMLSECGLAMLEYRSRYRAPVYVGDTLTARATVTRREPKPHRGGGLLFIATTLHNQDRTLVAEGEAVDLAAG